MYRTTQPQPSSISRDFITFGHEALAVHRAEERRTAERHRARINQTLQATRQTPWPRRALGTMMIALGTGISGKAARIQEREATSPRPGSGTRLVPTR
jgi:hypothetical protein